MSAMLLPKLPRINDRRITESARGETCTLRTPVCNGDSSTVVWCHSNLMMHGKGRGLKALPVFGCYGCSACHDLLDQRTNYSGEWEGPMAAFHRAMAKSLIRLIEKGIVVVR